MLQTKPPPSAHCAHQRHFCFVKIPFLRCLVWRILVEESVERGDRTERRGAQT
jgi:hypothetical protein